VLRRAAARSALIEAAEGCDRLVLLGDLLELRHGPMREALDAAEPVLRELGRMLGAGREVVVVPGNHDHRLLRGWLERRASEPAVPPLGLAAAVDWRAQEPLASIAAWLAPAELRASYPGAWLRDDIYATHGHYGDCHITVPTLERLAAGVMARVATAPDGGPGRAEDYEAMLAPIYAWIDAVAQSGGVRGRGGGGLQVRAWRALRPRRGRRRLRRAGVAVAFPALVAALNRAGLGPLGANVSGGELRRAALRAFAEVLDRLDVRAAHVIFGHTHRAGPLPDDELTEWVASSGASMLNIGSWIHDQGFVGDSPRQSPYRAGFCALVTDEGAPQLINLLDQRARG
jgi:hypothetical protein